MQGKRPIGDYALRIFALLLIVLFIVTPLSTTITNSIQDNNNNGLLIITTFPNLVKDIKLITCSHDRVVSLVPQGVDPHTYSLRPEDISLLSKADLIISTGHTSFEINIRQLYQKGALKGTLIEVPKIPGITLFNNPVTQKTNYHMPIYDPFNYMKFLSYVEKKLEELNPSCRREYREKLYTVFQKEALLLTNTSITNITVIADLPFTQYAVEWLGIHVKYLIVKEQGVQASPQDLIIIEKNLQEKQIGACIITSPVVNSASKKLLDLCNKYNIPILFVPSPVVNTTFVDKEIHIVSQLHGLIGKSTNQTNYNKENTTSEYIYLNKFSYIDLVLIVLAITLFISIIYIIRGRKV